MAQSYWQRAYAWAGIRARPRDKSQGRSSLPEPSPEPSPLTPPPGHHSGHPGLSKALCLVLVLLPPLVITYFWVRWGWRQVDGHELAIAPAGSSSFAVFIQLCRNYTEGYGWVQTVVPLYNNNWHWGGHYGPIIFLSAWISSWLESPWTLARWQVLAVGAGCFSAYLLGYAEAKLAGALAGLTLYASSATLVLIALYDYQDITFCLPLIPLFVWASRHGRFYTFVLTALLLGSVREECLLLLPALALLGGGRRAFAAGLLSLGYLGALEHFAGFFSGNVAPVVDISQRQTALGFPALGGLEWRYYLGVIDSASPWVFLSPWCTAVSAGISAFIGMPLASEWTAPSHRFLHHYAPLLGVSLTGAILGVTRLMRFGPLPAGVLLVAVLGSSLHSLSQQADRIRLEGIRITFRHTHPAWPLIKQVTPSDVLLVPRVLAPAAARRRFLATEDSLGSRISPSSVTHVIDDGQLEALLPPHYGGAVPASRVIATSGRWTLREVVREERKTLEAP